MSKDEMAKVMVNSKLNDVKKMYDYDKLMNLSRYELERKFDIFKNLETLAKLRKEI